MLDYYADVWYTNGRETIQNVRWLMERLYRFFDMEDVLFDDERSVKELMEYVFEKSDCYEPMGMDIVTVYDASKYYVVTDTSKKCKDELDPSGGNGFTVAYLKEDKFFFAEGGWGHHMIDMNAVKLIGNPINIRVVFDDFKNSVVINGNLTLGEIYAFLCDTTYISRSESNFFIGDLDCGKNPPLSECKKYGMCSLDQKVTLRQAVGDILEPVLIIKR